MLGFRILVVDDHEESTSALGRLLSRAGHDVRRAGSVADGLRSAAAVPPDLVISDLTLADGDGCELLRRIRELHPRVRGVAVSGYTGEPYEQRCLDAGFEILLAKPMPFELLLAAIASPSQARARNTTPAAAAPDPQAPEVSLMPTKDVLPNRSVLLVEDDNANRYAMRHMLKGFGLEVAEATSAAQAIEKLAASPSYVVLDWLIPGGGDAVLRHVRDHDLPARVVVVTVAYEERGDEILQMKPDALIKKPFNSAAVRGALGVAGPS
jgi:CheY-like chemotaxis protein